MTTSTVSHPSTPTPVRVGPFARWGALVYRRRRLTLVLGLVGLLVAGAVGSGVFGRLSGGGFEDPASESTRAAVTADRLFGRVGADVVVVYTAPAGSGLTVDSPEFAAAVDRAVSRLPRAEVASVATYWTTGRSPSFVSADRRSTYAALQLTGADEQAREDAYRRVADRLVADGLTTLRGGQVPVYVAMNTQVQEDIARAESLSFPLLLVLLVVVFGSLVAASLPLAVGAVAILGAFAALDVLTRVTDVSVFAVNIVTMLGLGLAIDYALFVVGRFREQLAAGDSVEQAVVATVATAGRTVAFSGLTVAVSLGALLLFPMSFLRSMGFGGIAAVVVAMVAALTVLPALLAVLGPRVDALRVPGLGRLAARPAPEGTGWWAALARTVMRRPLVVAGATVALLALLGAPFFRVAFGGVDERALPAGTESRVAMETLRADFPTAAAEPLRVVVRGAAPASVEQYADRLARLPGATGAAVVARQGDAALVDVTYRGPSSGGPARGLVDAVRAAPVPDGATALVGGESARLADLLSGIGARLPWAAGYLVVVTFALLFLAFGSVVLPVKAMVMNLLSLSATFGILVWGFQEGHLSSLLGFTSTGTLEATQPVLMLAMAFGLSMDYEVFLLSRMREEWDRTGDNALAVERGLERTGRVITSAAALFVVVVGSFATSGIAFIQMIGVGLAVAVLMDATVVRGMLVPATMRLLGRWNWWSPAPLARWWQRYGVREGSAVPGHPVEEPALA